MKCSIWFSISFFVLAMMLGAVGCDESSTGTGEAIPNDTEAELTKWSFGEVEEEPEEPPVAPSPDPFPPKNNPVDVCAGVDCSGNGVCYNDNGVAICDCDMGFRSVGRKCIAKPIAAVCVGVSCGGEVGYCTEDEGMPVCQCAPGYDADGLDCVMQDVEPLCENVNCGKGGVCRESEGLPVCECTEGYEADGLGCVRTPICDKGEYDGDFMVWRRYGADIIKGYTSISGHLVVENTSVVNLDELVCLKSIGGSLQIWRNGDLEHLDGLAGLKNVGGALFIMNNPRLEDADLPSLESVEGYLAVKNNENLVSVDLDSLVMTYDFELSANPRLNYLAVSHLTKLGGSLFVDSFDESLVLSFPELESVLLDLEIRGPGGEAQGGHLVALDLSGLRSVGGDFVLEGMPGLVMADVSSLETVGGDLSVRQMDSLSNFALKNLSMVDGHVEFSFLPQLEAIALHQLTGISSLVIRDTGKIRTLDFSSLRGITNDGMAVFNNSRLENVVFEQLHSCDGDLVVVDNPALFEMQVPFLSNITGGLIVRSNPTVDLMMFPRLSQIGREFVLENNQTLLLIRMPSLTYIGEGMNILFNENLNSLTFPMLGEFGEEAWGMSITDNEDLEHIELGQLSVIPGLLEIMRNPSLETVEFNGFVYADEIIIEDNDSLQSVVLPE